MSLESELKKFSANLENLLGVLIQILTSAPIDPITQTLPTSTEQQVDSLLTPAPTIEQVTAAFTTFIEKVSNPDPAAGMVQARAILKKHGLQKLGELKPENYGAFLNDIS